ncbi:MAG: hypothetical protein H7263_13910 [Candidatus Sericytochromatia bacterium]|nr:hypothetical protein [Candidatus Sericytochromatia bacterium]
MTQIPSNSGANPIYGNQQTNGTQPASYVPQGGNTSYKPDQYNAPQTQQQGGGLFSMGGGNKPYVTKQTVMTAGALALGGFMIAGPIGGIIGGIIGLLVGIFMNMSKMKKDGQGQQGQQAIPAQMNGMTPQQQQQMQQQQNQQTEQQQQMQQQQQQPAKKHWWQ